MAGLDESSRKWIRVRLGVVMGLFLLALLVVLGRAVYLQLKKGDELGDLARDQYLKELELRPRRGAIVDARGVPLAVSVATQSVVLDAKTANKPKENRRDLPPMDAEGASKLAKALKLEPSFVSKKLAGHSAFNWLKRRITPPEAEEVAALKLKGVAFAPEFKRYYPQKEVAAHVLGTVGIDNEGLEGIEKAQEASLRGEAREVQGLRDVRGNLLFEETGADSVAEPGATVQLTLDAVIQQATEAALAEGTAKAKAKAGVAVVMDPMTGAILALANVPTFNPNNPGDIADVRRNRVVTDQFEPGSTMKTFLAAAGFAEGIVSPETLIDVSGGVLQIGKRKIRDSHPPPENVLPFWKVFAISSNVGCAKVGMRLGPKRLIDWYKRFGFAERTGSGLPGEAKGVLQKPDRMGETGTATTAFGQGLSATPLQMTTALSAVANGGKLMKPYVVAKVTRADGEVVLERKPEVVREVMPKAAADKVVYVMKKVVGPEGTGGLAGVPGYTVAGKTGTAQKADPITHGYGSKRYSSFMGFLPADAPRVVIYVALDEPSGDVYGGKIAAPIFKQIAMAALQQLSIPPETAPDPIQVALEQKLAAEQKTALAAAKKKGLKLETKPEAEVSAFDDDFVDDTGIAEATQQGGLTVPDLKGLSARAALRLLGERSLEADLEGSGRAIDQTPPAGALVTPGTRIHVVMGSG